MIIFLFGPDDYRAKQKIRELKSKFRKEVDDTDSGLLELSADWTAVDLHDAVAANSLFSRRRFVVVENILGHKDKDFLDHLLVMLPDVMTNDNVVIFYEPKLAYDKKKDLVVLDSDGKEKKLTISQKKIFSLLLEGTNQNFNNLIGKDLLVWISRHTEANGVQISQPAAQLMMIGLGSNLWLMSNELDKLIAYKKANNASGMISTEDVKLFSVVSNEENIFALSDAISNKNIKKFIELLEDQLANGLSPVYLLSMLLRQVKILLQTLVASEKGMTSRQLASELGLHPYVAEKVMSQARNFRSVELKRLYDDLLKLDGKIKSGQADFKVDILRLFSGVK